MQHIQFVTSALAIIFLIWLSRNRLRGHLRSKPLVSMSADTRDLEGLPLNASIELRGKVLPSSRGLESSPAGYGCVWWQRVVYSRDTQVEASNREFRLQDQYGEVTVLPEGIDLKIESRKLGKVDGYQVEEKILGQGEQVRIMAQLGQTPEGKRYLYNSPDGEQAYLKFDY